MALPNPNESVTQLPTIMSSQIPHFIGAVEDDWAMFSDDPVDYDIGAPIGFGASSIVYAATYTPKASSTLKSTRRTSYPCAVKVLDLDKLPQSALPLLTRETRLMSLSKHPNVIRVRGSWMTDHRVYIALRLMRAGSVRDVMRYRNIDGIEEDAIKCILKQALQGLKYLHVNGFIHRDIKAANLLIDDDGTVLLGDLGVAVSLSDDPTSSHATSMPSTSISPPSSGYYYSTLTPTPSQTQSSSSQSTAVPLAVVASTTATPTLGRRKSFVGTPCWMAPEVISQKSSSAAGIVGYNSSADIYSLGITALELAHGRAPHSLDPPYKALLKTLQNASPTLDRGKGYGKGLMGKNGGYKFSQELKDIIDACLLKDPTRRPTAGQLLNMPYFKAAKRKEYLVGVLLEGLPPLIKRQERRTFSNLHGTSLASTKLSWDFGASIYLPPSRPVSGLSQLESATRGAQVILPPHGVFVMEGEVDDLEEADESDSPESSGSNRAEPENNNDNDGDEEDDSPQLARDAPSAYPSPRATPHRVTSAIAEDVQQSAGTLPTKTILPPMTLPAPTRPIPVRRATTGNGGLVTPPESSPSAAASTSNGDNKKWSLSGTLGRTSSRLLGRSK